MTTLREFIAERRAQINDEIAALRVEGRELKVALAAIDADDGPANGTRRPSGKLTIKDRIVQVLREHPQGGSVEAIIEWVDAMQGVAIPRSSLSPQISRLKAEGVVILNEDKNWQLAEYARADQEAAGGEQCGTTTPPTIFEHHPNGVVEPRAQGREGVSG